MDWQNDLIMCPSQCVAETGVENIILYMRWRHDDPWTFAVVHDIDADHGGDWYDVYDAPRFSHDEYEAAQKWFEKWWRDVDNINPAIVYFAKEIAKRQRGETEE